MKTTSILIAAAVLATAMPAAAQQASSGISTQLTALGLDPATVRASLESLNRDDRIVYLRNLGVEFAVRPVRPDAVEGVTTPLLTVNGDKAIELSKLPAGEMHILPIEGEMRILPIDGEFHILPMPIDISARPLIPTQALPNGVISSSGDVRILPMPVDIAPGSVPGSLPAFSPMRPGN